MLSKDPSQADIIHTALADLKKIGNKFDKLKELKTLLEKYEPPSKADQAKAVFKSIGMAFATFYVSILWTPLIPLMGLIATANAFAVAKFGTELDGRKGQIAMQVAGFDEVQQKLDAGKSAP